MSTRRAKQIVYGALYVILWILFFWAVYFVFVRPFGAVTPTVPSCTSDCAPQGAQNIATSSVSVFVASPNHYTFLDQVTDEAPNFAAESFSYQFDLYNASGTLLGSVPGGQSFLYANQTKYLVLPNQEVATSFDYAVPDISNVQWVEGSALGVAPQFSVQNLEYDNGTTTVSVSGDLANPGIQNFAKVLVVAIFDGPDGTPIGASDTELDGVGPGATVEFSVMYPALPGVNASDVHLFEYALPQ